MTQTATLSHNGLTSHVAGVLLQVLSALEKFTGPEIEALKASAKDTMDRAVAASGPIAEQIFNFGLESIPGLKLIAPAIEIVADPIVGTIAGNVAKSLESDVEAGANRETAALNSGQISPQV